MDSARGWIDTLLQRHPDVKPIEVFRLLLALNGRVGSVDAYLKGEHTHHRPWTANEDKILLGSDASGINLIITFRGADAVKERIEFISSEQVDD